MRKNRNPKITVNIVKEKLPSYPRDEARFLERIRNVRESSSKKEIESESEKRKRHETFFKWTGKKIKSNSEVENYPSFLGGKIGSENLDQLP